VNDDYKEITIVLPKPPSLNQFYAGRHYSVRTKHKAEYWRHIQHALTPHDKFHMERYKIDVRFNCRYDVDNAICCCKFLADYLRNNGYVDDDSPKYFTEQSTKYDQDIEKNTFEVTIKGYGYKVIKSNVLPRDVADALRSDIVVRKPARRGRKSKD